MNKEETNALQLLTGKTNLADVRVEELEQLATAHPYFSAVQLLLSKKMQQENESGLQNQIYKTALYFPDESWLRYLLTDWKNTEDNNNNVSSLRNDVATAEHKVAENDSNHNLQNGIQTEKPEDENIITFPAEDILEEVSNAFDVHDEPEEAPLDDEELAAQLSSPLPIEESHQKIASILSEQAVEFQKPVTEDETTVPIQSEPFHTVDYFASQGIQLEPKKEETSFDTKVHKFTDWLRQMKRINPHPSDLGTDVEQESYVADIAATSNQTKEIVTESMAEVLLKQNKNGKAVEIYEKLSLLYPAKNAYFAAKIEQLKQ